MTIKEHLRKNIVLATPVIIGQLGHIMVSVADSVMVGRIGVIPLAAATFAGTIYHVLMLFGIGVSYAITPKVAATDTKDRPRLLKFLQNGFFMNLGLGILLFTLGCFASHFLQYFGQEVPVAEAAGPYLIIMCGSLIPLMIFQTFRQYAEGLSDTFSPMAVSVLANLLNVFFNYMLIYGKLGAPALGLNGAGLATLMARIIMFTVMIWWVKGKISGFEWKYDWSGIKDLLRIGLPSGLQYVFEIGAFATAAIMVGWIGAEALAAHNIALNLAAISYMAATGLAAASTIRIGNQIRLRDRRNLRIAGFSSFSLVTVFMATCALIFIVFRNVLPTLYIEDVYVQGLASTLLVIAAAFQISDGIQAVGLGVLRGLQDVKIPTLVTFVSYWLVAIPLGYVFAFELDWGINGIWYALSLGLTLAGIFNMWRFNRLSRKIVF